MLIMVMIGIRDTIGLIVSFAVPDRIVFIAIPCMLVIHVSVAIIGIIVIVVIVVIIVTIVMMSSIVMLGIRVIIVVIVMWCYSCDSCFSVSYC